MNHGSTLGCSSNKVGQRPFAVAPPGAIALLQGKGVRAANPCGLGFRDLCFCKGAP